MKRTARGIGTLLRPSCSCEPMRRLLRSRRFPPRRSTCLLPLFVDGLTFRAAATISRPAGLTEQRWQPAHPPLRTTDTAKALDRNKLHLDRANLRVAELPRDRRTGARFDAHGVANPCETVAFCNPAFTNKSCFALRGDEHWDDAPWLSAGSCWLLSAARPRRVAAMRR
jgi:hypothetical protein